MAGTETVEARLERLEREKRQERQAIAENTHMFRGNWQGPKGSAAAEILHEWLAAEIEAADREAARRAEIEARVTAELQREGVAH